MRWCTDNTQHGDGAAQELSRRASVEALQIEVTRPVSSLSPTEHCLLIQESEEERPTPGSSHSQQWKRSPLGAPWSFKHPRMETP